MGFITQIPYLPSFNKIAAKIIEPITGASTCALGNHTWAPNIGNFTTKAIRLIKIKINEIDENLIQEFIWIISKLDHDHSLIIHKIINKKGIDAVNV